MTIKQKPNCWHNSETRKLLFHWSWKKIYLKGSLNRGKQFSYSATQEMFIPRQKWS